MMFSLSLPILFQILLLMVGNCNRALLGHSCQVPKSWCRVGVKSRITRYVLSIIFLDLTPKPFGFIRELLGLNRGRCRRLREVIRLDFPK